MTLHPVPDRCPDVVLVRPRDFGAVPEGAPVQDPLGIGYLAAALRGRALEVVVLDAHALDLDDEGLAACIAALRPNVVGLSLHSFSCYSHCVAVSERLRREASPPFCVWGGEHATFHAQDILRKHPEVDAVVMGEGEESFAELVLALRERGSAPDEPVCGVLMRGREGNLLDGGFRPAVEDLDRLPDPHKDVVEMALRRGRQVGLSVLTGRGCTHRCRFCTAHDFLRLGGGKVWRRRSPKAVADEVERLAATYLQNPLVHPVLQFQDVIFLGTSTASRRWVDEYLTELEQRGLSIPFYCMTRADSILANEANLPRLVRAGLWSVEMGIESGVERILKAYNKCNSADDNQRAVELLRANGITFDASGFIMFDPFMTPDELRENAAYLTRFGAATWDFFVTRLQLYPGTPLRQEMIDRGLFDPEDDIGKTSGYRFENPIVDQVARQTYYYDLSIRTLDLALRDAKAAVAIAVRTGSPAQSELQAAIDLVHRTYCEQLLALTDAAEAGAPQSTFDTLIAEFLERVARLTAIMHQLLEWATDSRDKVHCAA